MIADIVILLSALWYFLQVILYKKDSLMRISLNLIFALGLLIVGLMWSLADYIGP